MIIQQNKDGVINTPDWCFHLYHTSSWSANEVCHRYHLFYLVNTNLGYSSKLCIYFGHHDPSSGKPLGHFQVLVSRNTNHHGLCINISQNVEQVFTISKHHKTCSMAWQVKEFLLSYYKKLQNGSNWIIVSKQWHTIAGKPAAGKMLRLDGLTVEGHLVQSLHLHPSPDAGNQPLTNRFRLKLEIRLLRG